MTLAPAAYQPWLTDFQVEDRTDQETGVRYYRQLPNGSWFVSVTTVLKIIAKGWQYDNWIAKQERDKHELAIAQALLEPVAREYFLPAVKAKVGNRLVYQTVRDDAADDGKAVHEAVRRFLEAELGMGAPPAPALSAEGLVNFATFVDWWRSSGLRAVRMEQPLIEPVWGYAGRCDWLAEHPTDGLGILDLKNTKYVSDSYHLQLAAYLRAARRHDEVRWGQIIKLPKGGRGMEVVSLGEKMWCGPRDESELLNGFKAAIDLWRALNSRGPA